MNPIGRPLVVLLLALAACAEPTVDGGVTTPGTPTSDPSPPAAIASTPTVASPPGTEGEATAATLPPETLSIEAFPVPAGSRPHDVAPAADGGVWYTAQGSGELGWLDPGTGETEHTALGPGSRPHGVIVDASGTPWITDGGLNAIVSVDPATLEVTAFPLPPDRPAANLNTAAFDGDGLLWFTGQSGVYGSLDPRTGEMTVYDAPEGRGPYGITATPDGSVFYASLAGSHIAAIEDDGSASVVEPPTADQGARRVWSDSGGAIWVSEWNSGNVSRYEPGSGAWGTWRLPGDRPTTYAVFVDDHDIVWASDFGSNEIVRFDPAAEGFHVYPLPHDPGEVRQLLGRPGEVWGAESAADHLVLIRTAAS